MRLKVILFITGFLWMACHWCMGQYYEPDHEKSEKSERTQKEDSTVSADQKNQKDRKDFWDRVYAGGSFSMQFGNITQVYLAPVIGYHITSRFSSGIGATYMYYSFKRNYNSGMVDASTQIYGGSLFSRYQLNTYLFAHAELENLNVEYYNTSTEQLERRWITSPLVGAGYFQSVGAGGGGITFMALYNLNHMENISPYGSPLIIRIGFTL